MKAPIDGTPLILVAGDDEASVAGDTSHLVWVIGHDGDDMTLAAPQFGVEVRTHLSGDEVLTAVESLVKAMVAELVDFYQALTELPVEYINEVEQAQLTLSEKIVFPWFAKLVGGQPGTWSVPSALLDSATRKPHLV
jgi:hypothetical protein